MTALRLLLVSLLCLAPASGSARVTQNATSGGIVLTCVKVWGEARYAPYGYDHVIHLASGCDQAARCDVATDVDPKAISVVVEPREHVEVITRRRSPAREFTPRAVCYAFED